MVKKYNVTITNLDRVNSDWNKQTKEDPIWTMETNIQMGLVYMRWVFEKNECCDLVKATEWSAIKYRWKEIVKEAESHKDALKKH